MLVGPGESNVQESCLPGDENRTAEPEHCHEIEAASENGFLADFSQRRIVVGIRRRSKRVDRF